MTWLVNVCKFSPASSGTGDFVVSAAVQGYQTPAQAGAFDGVLYYYRAENADLSEWEIGYGVYTAGSTTLARTTIVASSTGSKVSFSTAPQVGLVALATSYRFRLLSALNVYVDPSGGDDSNSGFIVGSPKKTIAAMYAACRDLFDLAGFQITCNLPSGTFTLTSGETLIGRMTGSASSPSGNIPFVIKGAGSGSTIFQSSTNLVALLQAQHSEFEVSAMQCRSTGTSGFILLANAGYIVGGSDMWYGKAGDAILDAGGSTSGIYMRDPFTVLNENSNIFAVAEDSALISLPTAMTISGSPSMADAWVQGDLGGMIDGSGFTYTGSGVGTRYNASSGGKVFTGGVGTAGFFPGNLPGVKDSISYYG